MFYFSVINWLLQNTVSAKYFRTNRHVRQYCRWSQRNFIRPVSTVRQWQNPHFVYSYFIILVLKSDYCLKQSFINILWHNLKLAEGGQYLVDHRCRKYLFKIIWQCKSCTKQHFKSCSILRKPLPWRNWKLPHNCKTGSKSQPNMTISQLQK